MCWSPICPSAEAPLFPVSGLWASESDKARNKEIQPKPENGFESEDPFEWFDESPKQARRQQKFPWFLKNEKTTQTLQARQKLSNRPILVVRPVKHRIQYNGIATLYSWSWDKGRRCFLRMTSEETTRSLMLKWCRAPWLSKEGAWGLTPKRATAKKGRIALQWPETTLDL